MSIQDTRLLLLQAYDEGMINGDYIYLGNDDSYLLSGDEILHRHEVSDRLLYEGFITVLPELPSGPNWDQLREDVIEAFDDPKFEGYSHVEDPVNVHDYAGILDSSFSHRFVSCMLLHIME